ncbi:RNA polymerase sigma factor SigJ [Frankia nepalensis]|uniref:RNA polymerase sigma factor SigJ n=1 Tax=Frankia nepalensis TaxID=1836974 RepID=UPI0019324EA4|nr:RNA polymerase sigma factor SigJ [Frankia nepalensis]MBL7514213.1 RNA polymerase sigma factor SigJ [Frankia nepalensis]
MTIAGGGGAGEDQAGEDRGDAGGPGRAGRRGGDRAAALASAFEAERGYLRGLAYRILGSFTDAEDVVQEAWLRLDRADVEPDDLRAWLTVVVGRLCLDELRSARARRESYVGQWLPEPLAEAGGLDATAVYGAGSAAGMATPAQHALVEASQNDVADRVTLAESVSMAMLVVMDTLTPAERTALVLHDVFGYGFEEVAQVTGRTPAASRQLASRARRRVRADGARFDPDPARGWKVAEAFHAAATGGDLGVLVELLDPDIVLRSDGGGLARAARRPIVGRDKVARFLLGILEKDTREPGEHAIVPAAVNGGPGFLHYTGGELATVAALTVAEGRVQAIDFVSNPDKLHHLRGPAGPVPGPA